ncbi:2-hydroxyacid dehydrogenase [Sporomusa aerivorans]|uniref:2-hydroxyacid dehydrogenase n=1 Tax=Sporomusa aerivorans TaxID=204936 RepID=UPI00352AC1E2
MNCIFFDTIGLDMQALVTSAQPQEIQVVFWSELNEKEQATALRNADAFMVATYPITAQLLKQAPKVKIVQKMGVGVDNIDSKAAAALGIAVGNVPGGNANGVAELTIALILNLYRHICALNQATKNCEWQMWKYRSCSYEIKGKTHGVIGFGYTGRETARLSRAFGSSILYSSTRQAAADVEKQLGARYVPLDELLREADIVSIHVPLLSQTVNLIDKDKLALMKDSAILVNVSRGNIVNEADLYQALVNRSLFGVALDVWSQEPVNAGHPLLSLDNVIALPHVGGGTVDAAINIYQYSFANMLACFRGQQFHAL